MKAELISGLIGAIGFPIVGFVISLLLPNKKVTAWGVAAGKALSIFAGQKIGRTWEPVESKLQGTISAFMDGMHEGLDFDDK